MRIPRIEGLIAKLVALATAAAVVVAMLLVLAAVHLLPQIRNPFAQTTTVRSSQVLLKSITALSRYEAASGSFQVVIDLTKHTSFLPSYIAGSQTLFIGQGSVIAYVNFSQLKGKSIQVSPNHSTVTITLPDAQLEPPVLNVHQSYVFAEQQGLLNRVADFFSGNPNGQQQVYILAQQRIAAAAQHSQLLSEAQQNTKDMLQGMLRSLGFRQITVNFSAAGSAQ
jgi:Protein of unknown function (DUF4230)